MILTIRSPKFEVFQTKIKEIRSVDRKLTGDRYYVCAGDVITLIPVKASRHLHVYVFTDFETLEDYNKSIEYLRTLGFRVVEECRAASGQ